ncbi:MAG: hypothetical protein ABI885_23215 [Gammaproteobacteria bacterium]
MSQTLYPPAAPQSIGQVLDSAFRIFKVSLVPCLLYGAVAIIAGQLQNIYTIAAGKPLRSFNGRDPVWIALYAAGAITSLVMAIALVLRQRDIATGARRGTSIELSEAIRRLPGLLGLIILCLLLVGVGPLILGGVYALMGPTAAGYTTLGALFLIMLAPLTYVLTPLSLVTSAFVLDGASPLEAIRYVFRLIKGCWWRTSTIFTVAMVITIVFYAVAAVVIGVVVSLTGAAADFAAVTAATGVVYVVLGGVGMPFFAAIVLAVYGELKVRRGGLDLEQRIADAVQT